MPSNVVHTAGWLVAAAALAVGPPIGAQQQQRPAANASWPCGARIDPAYFHIAEGTGGHLLLLAPGEIADSAALFTALGNHPQTIFRLAGTMKPGLHEIHVPIEPSVESVVFSISVQCLQAADVLRPSGTPVTGADVTDLSNFRAERMVIVPRPESGVWTIRASGSGVAGVVVQGRSAIGITQVEFAPAGSTAFSAEPVAGVENAVRIRVSGHVTRVEAALVNGAFRRIAPLPLTPGDAEGSFVSRFTPGTEGFRVLVEGKDTEGLPFQRVHAPLLTATR
jgi:hypothetical protein